MGLLDKIKAFLPNRRNYGMHLAGAALVGMLAAGSFIYRCISPSDDNSAPQIALYDSSPDNSYSDNDYEEPIEPVQTGIAPKPETTLLEETDLETIDDTIQEELAQTQDSAEGDIETEEDFQAWRERWLAEMDPFERFCLENGDDELMTAITFYGSRDERRQNALEMMLENHYSRDQIRASLGNFKNPLELIRGLESSEFENHANADDLKRTITDITIQNLDEGVGYENYRLSELINLYSISIENEDFHVLSAIASRISDRIDDIIETDRRDRGRWVSSTRSNAMYDYSSLLYRISNYCESPEQDRGVFQYTSSIFEIRDDAERLLQYVATRPDPGSFMYVSNEMDFVRATERHNNQVPDRFKIDREGTLCELIRVRYERMQPR